MATNYCHLSKEQRNEIENLLNKNFSFTYIGDALKVDRTTISKEIRRNRYLKHRLNLIQAKKCKYCVKVKFLVVT